MPACLAASMMVMPLGTLTRAPSMVTLTSSSAIAIGRGIKCRTSHCCQSGLASALDVRLELLAELLNSAHDRRRAGVAEDADRLAGHVVRQIEQQLEMFLFTLAGQNPLQNPN